MLKTHGNLNVTVRENVFQEAEWQFICSVLIFFKNCVCSGFASALGKFASLCRSNALRSNPSQTLDDMAQLENRSHAWPT